MGPLAEQGPFSPAQLVGYAAFLLGVVSFLQRDDRRLRTMVGLQAFSYAVHFVLLGSITAAAVSLVTFARAMISLRTRSPRIGVALLVLNVALGVATAHSAASWLPVLASCAGTVAFFWFEGIPMRLILLGATAFWLANNLLVGSIGGTLLELFIAAANGSTCYRLWRSRTPLAPRSP